jgi:hypothetical protein
MVIKVTTKAITTDPWQFQASLKINGIEVYTAIGDTRHARKDVRKMATDWLKTNWDNPKVIEAANG